MVWFKNTKKSLGFIACFLFVMTGTYNAVVINSESSISSDDVKFVKRLDEIYGIVKPGRMVAASTSWKKLKNVEKTKSIVQKVNRLDAAPKVASVTESVDEVVAAAVQEDLDLSLIEVINPKKWKQGLQGSQFYGNLLTNNGIIESLSVSLPNGEGISVNFREMTGNVFEYDLHGELYSGMMYQVDQNSYMVTLSNGPLEGTRLRFSQNASPAEAQQELAQNHQIEAGQFGQDRPEAYKPEEISQYDQAIQSQGLQAQSFNMEQQTF